MLDKTKMSKELLNECVIDTLLVASDFSQIGIVLIMLGTIILIAKPFV